MLNNRGRAVYLTGHENELNWFSGARRVSRRAIIVVRTLPRSPK